MRLRAEPQLLVTDLDAALAHYGRLGFEAVFVHGEPAFYAQVRRDEARLNLRHVDRLPVDRAFAEAEPEVLAATVTVDDAERLFRELETADVAFHQSLRTEAWGTRTFIVVDPDGNLILFAG